MSPSGFLCKSPNSPTSIFLVWCLSWKFHSFHLLAPSSPGPLRSLHSASGWGRRMDKIEISVLWIRAGGDQHHCCRIPLRTTGPLGHPQLQGRLGSVGGCVPWRQRETISRTIHQFLPLIVSMVKMKLPLLTVGIKSN